MPGRTTNVVFALLHPLPVNTDYFLSGASNIGYGKGPDQIWPINRVSQLSSSAGVSGAVAAHCRLYALDRCRRAVEVDL